MSGKVSNYNFEWDPKKAKQNIKKHKVSFERAATVFLDSNALTIYDEEHAEIEDRWITIGMDKAANLIVVCHTFHPVENDNFQIRVISARKPTKTEIMQYKELL
ncbi:MAG: BrnT family toxin [Candidatus Aminicenantes bacterium]|nr:BrnT family toxin [Candidatus Aminicenantes bacterium]NIM78414.1 BrnT family toxin [Candidatus Aminicenantes bacterium]NIN17676.1 BrnT family toxin [Candidatus Aminicenantes bacterium]NIN41552.1 BrnT family toxin [Candidatus Aminicenantes bacterium]NIN84326.1 BrnT family toxin [Candidatus Aminicenantes bacterium]